MGFVRYKYDQKMNFINPFKKFYKSIILKKKPHRNLIINFMKSQILQLRYNKKDKNLDQIM